MQRYDSRTCRQCKARKTKTEADYTKVGEREYPCTRCCRSWIEPDKEGKKNKICTEVAGSSLPPQPTRPLRARRLLPAVPGSAAAPLVAESSSTALTAPRVTRSGSVAASAPVSKRATSSARVSKKAASKGKKARVVTPAEQQRDHDLTLADELAKTHEIPVVQKKYKGYSKDHPLCISPCPAIIA